MSVLQRLGKNNYKIINFKHASRKCILTYIIKNTRFLLIKLLIVN